MAQCPGSQVAAIQQFEEKPGVKMFWACPQLQHCLPPGEIRHPPGLHLSPHKAKVTSNTSRQMSEKLSLALSFVFSSGHWDKVVLQEMLSVEKIQTPLPQVLTGT